MTTKKTRIKHAPEFKAVKEDAKISDRERELATKNAKLKRLLAEQAEEPDIVKCRHLLR